MTTKIRIKVGGVEVDYEGPEAFLNKKLPELISQLSTLAKQVPDEDGSGGGGTGGGSNDKKTGTLAAFIKEKKASKNQNKRFLATAEWLHRGGLERIKTADVTGAISKNHQSALGNPSQCLNSNVTSGYCVKSGKDFYVTDEGRSSLA